MPNERHALDMQPLRPRPNDAEFAKWSLAQRIHDFDDRHEPGGNVGYVFRGWIYYCTGAVRQVNAYGQLQEPPADDLERMRLIRFYWTKRHDLIEREYMTELVACRNMVRVAGTAMVGQLRRLRDELLTLKEKVASCQSYIDTHPRTVAERKRDAEEAAFKEALRQQSLQAIAELDLTS